MTKILVVDNDLLLLEYMPDLLAGREHSVEMDTDGLEAIARLARGLAHDLKTTNPPSTVPRMSRRAWEWRYRPLPASRKMGYSVNFGMG